MSLRLVRSFKASAKDARDDREWPRAVRFLDRALTTLKEMVPPGGQSPGPEIDAELADTYGMVGGVERRWGLDVPEPERTGHLEKSVDAYDEGFVYERRLDTGHAPTYNRMNRIVGRALIRPEVLDTGEPKLDIGRELTEIERVLAGQLDRTRRGDPWAQCDLIMARLLAGAPVDSAIRTLGTMRARRFVYDSLLDTLKPLTESAGSVRPQLHEAARQLEDLRRTNGT